MRLEVGNHEEKTQIKQKTTNPRWEESFRFLLVDPELQDLFLEVRIIVHCLTFAYMIVVHLFSHCFVWNNMQQLCVVLDKGILATFSSVSEHYVLSLEFRLI